MKKQIALGIAAAVLGVSGVASAVVSVDQLTSAASSESSISAVTDSLAANCWMVTGSASDAGCNTSIAGIEVPGLPELPNLVPGVDIPDATGLLAMASNAVDTATGALGSAQSIVGSLVPTASGLAGGACNLPVSLPVKLVPASIFSAGLNLFHMAQNLAMNDLGAASLASPVELPVSVLTPDDVINTVEDQFGCLAAQAGGAPIPAACTANLGAPEELTGVIPGEISGLLGTVAQQLAGITGQGINVASSANLGVTCDQNAIVDGTPLGSVISTVAPLVGTVTSNVGSVTGTAGSVTGTAGIAGIAGTATGTVTDAVGSVAGVTDTVTGLLDTVTGTVDGLLGGDLLSVPALPLPTSTPTCSASASGSANLLGGLLGSLTSTITGGCN